MSDLDAQLAVLDDELHPITLEDVRRFVRMASEYHQDWQGMPVPVEGQRIVLHKRHPMNGRKIDALNSVYAAGGEPEVVHECHVDDGAREVIVNGWKHSRRHAYVYVLRTAEGRAKVFVQPLPPDGSMRRLALWMNTMGSSDAWTLEAEYKAREKLRGMLSERQWRMYDLTGSFLESSPRSRVTYFLRRLRPTIAMTPRWRERGDRVAPDLMRCLAVLCLHPVGYYADTWAGCMTPTDDVIAHLLLIRGDEADYWGQANQHDPASPEAGL